LKLISKADAAANFVRSSVGVRIQVNHRLLVADRPVVDQDDAVQQIGGSRSQHRPKEEMPA